MEIKQKPPTDLEIAEAVAEMQSGLVKDTPFLRETLRLASGLPRMGRSPLAGTLSTHQEIERIKRAMYKRMAYAFDDHRTASTPPEPIAVHGDGE